MKRPLLQLNFRHLLMLELLFCPRFPFLGLHNESVDHTAMIAWNVLR